MTNSDRLVIRHSSFVISKMARRRGAAPRGLSFGDSAAQAGARHIKRNAVNRASALNKIKGREHHAPGPCDFNKEQTPLAVLRHQPAVSRRLFRCLGHTSSEALKM